MRVASSGHTSRFLRSHVPGIRICLFSQQTCILVRLVHFSRVGANTALERPRALDTRTGLFLKIQAVAVNINSRPSRVLENPYLEYGTSYQSRCSNGIPFVSLRRWCCGNGRAAMRTDGESKDVFIPPFAMLSSSAHVSRMHSAANLLKFLHSSVKLSSHAAPTTLGPKRQMLSSRGPPPPPV